VIEEFIKIHGMFFDKTNNITANDLLNVSEPIKYAPQLISLLEIHDRGVKVAESFIGQPIEQVIDGLIDCWVRWIRLLDDQTVQQFIAEKKQLKPNHTDWFYWPPDICRENIIGYWQEYYTF
jgi:hypothetical protein